MNEHLLPKPKGAIWYYQLGRMTEQVIRDTRLNPVAKVLVLVITYLAMRNQASQAEVNWAELERWVRAARGTMYWGTSKASTLGLCPLSLAQQIGYFHQHVAAGCRAMVFTVDKSVDNPQGPDARDQGPDARDQGPDARDQGPDARDQGPDARDQGEGLTEQAQALPEPEKAAANSRDSRKQQLQAMIQGVGGGTRERREIRKDSDPDHDQDSEDRKRIYELSPEQLHVWRDKWKRKGIAAQKTEMLIRSAQRLAHLGLLKPNEAVALVIRIGRSGAAQEWPLMMGEELAKLSGLSL